MKDEQQSVTDICAAAAGYLANKDLKSALTNYQKALEIDKNCYDGLVGCGLVYFKMSGELTSSENKSDLFNNAIIHFEKADSIKPVEKDILLCMQEIYSAQGSGSSTKLKGINERLHEE
jgi:Tfp pilus assembly protein PilF